jgi:flagellar hook-length control protein FliK
MQNLPISPSITPVVPPQAAPSQAASSQAAAGASDNAATPPSGEDFNTVLARQLATEPGGTADKKGKVGLVALAGGAPAAVETATATKATKPTDKHVASPVDGVTTAAQNGMMALLATPMVATEPKLAATQVPTAPETPSTGAGTGSPGERTLLGQLQADESKGVAGGAVVTERAAPSEGAANVAANTEMKFSAAMQAAVNLHTVAVGTAVAGQQQSVTTTDPAKDAQALAQSQVQAQNLAASPVPVPVNASQNLAVSTPVGSNRWNEDLGQKITWMAGHGNQSAELQLNPPDLGPLNVVLNVSGDQATALFTSPHAAVRDAVQQALPKLREMLADNGIMLGNASVSDQGRQGAQSGFSGGGNKSSSSSSRGAIEVSSVQQGSRSVSTLQTQGLVDTFA